MTKSRGLKIALVGSIILIACAAAYGVHIANGPDFEVTMTRTIPSKLSPEYIDQVISSLKTWPAWYHAGETADEVDYRGNPYPKSMQKVETRGLIRLGLDNHFGLHSRFDLTLLVLDYAPDNKIRMRVLSDSKNKLTTLFDDIEWQIELIPNGSGTLIRGTASAHTRNWHARLLGKLVPNIIMNQIFYPNLFVLAEFNNPSVVYPDPAEHGGM